MNKFSVGDLVQQLVEIHVSPIGIVVAIKEKTSPLPSDVVEVLWINGDRRNEWTDNLRKIKVKYTKHYKEEVRHE